MAPSPARKLGADLQATLDENAALIDRLAGLAGDLSRQVADFKSDRQPNPSEESPSDAKS